MLFSSMTGEDMSSVTLGGKPIKLNGAFPQPGQTAPDFSLVASDLAQKTLADFAGKRKVLNIVPSLDTPTCAISTRKFNERAGSLTDTVVLVISADLPFAMKRFCSTEGINNVVPLSLLRGRDFLAKYGVEIAEGPMVGLAARAVVVLDKDNKVIHSQLVPEIKNEPDYDAALTALS